MNNLKKTRKMRETWRRSEVGGRRSWTETSDLRGHARSAHARTQTSPLSLLSPPQVSAASRRVWRWTGSRGYWGSFRTRTWGEHLRCAAAAARRFATAETMPVSRENSLLCFPIFYFLSESVCVCALWCVCVGVCASDPPLSQAA